jgi:hypothetical protein
VFIVGVSIFARGEAGTSRRGALAWGLAVMVAGLALLAAFPHVGVYARGTARLTLPSTAVWATLVLLLGFSIVRRSAAAVADPRSARVQAAVKHSILSLIVLDAAVCLAVRSPVWWSVGIVALLVPALALGRWVYST